MRPPSPLTLLSRTDKWYLGGGNRLVYAPPFPLHKTSPGLWDTTHYYNYPIQSLFSWALLMPDGKQLPITYRTSDWQPDRLLRRFDAKFKGISLSIEERSTVLPNDVALSVLRIRNQSSQRLKLRVVAWTVKEHSPGRTVWLEKSDVKKNVFTCLMHLKPPERVELLCATAFGISGDRVRSSVQISEGSAPLPDWSMTPFAESALNGPLTDNVNVGDPGSSGLLFVASEKQITLAPRGVAEISIGCAFGPDRNEVHSNLTTVLRQKNPILLSQLSWSDHFASVPSFTCSDPFLNRYYWYRWYGLRLNTILSGEGNYEYPAVCEGIGYFRAPISYSAPCHILENRWMNDPELAQGSLLTFIHNQRDDGGFRGYIDAREFRSEMFYHANWGKAVLALDAVHPSRDFLEQAYEGLKKYAAYFDKERDEEVSGLYDIDNHYETGQEFMHRYTVVDPNADKDNWGEVFRLKGVDVTVYIYELKKALAQISGRLGKSDESELWSVEASKIGEAVRQLMWDPSIGMFFDVDPKTGKQTGVKAATCFYPYFTDIVGKEHIPGLKKHLLSTKEFWTPWPVPSTSRDDETFSAEPVWKGKRMNCPWNGRVWPMTNSHIMEALATTAVRFGDAKLERAASDFFQKFIRMMFFDGDPTRPNCFEHYNPLTGSPSVYRGIDDYMHSWVNDLIIKYVMGVQPGDHSVTIRPLTMGLQNAELFGIHIRGHEVRVKVEKNSFTVWLDGKFGGKRELGGEVELQV